MPIPFGISEAVLDDALILRRVITKELALKLMAGYERGDSLKTLAKNYNISRYAITMFFIAVRVPIRRYLYHARNRNWTRNQCRDAALALYHGASFPELHKIYDIQKSKKDRFNVWVLDTLVEDLGLEVPKRYRWNKNALSAQVQMIIEDYKSGKSLQAIADKHHKPSYLIGWYLHRYGIRLSRPPWKKISEADKIRMVDEFLDGATINDLAEMFKVSIVTISVWLRQLIGCASSYPRWLILQNMDKKGFKPGVNFPDHVPTKAGHIRRYCQKLSIEVLELAHEIAVDDAARSQDRLKAIEMILDRAWGKPKEVPDDNDEGGNLPPDAKVLKLVSPRLRTILEPPKAPLLPMVVEKSDKEN